MTRSRQPVGKLKKESSEDARSALCEKISVQATINCRRKEGYSVMAKGLNVTRSTSQAGSEWRGNDYTEYNIMDLR